MVEFYQTAHSHQVLSVFGLSYSPFSTRIVDAAGLGSGAREGVGSVSPTRQTTSFPGTMTTAWSSPNSLPVVAVDGPLLAQVLSADFAYSSIGYSAVRIAHAGNVASGGVREAVHMWSVLVASPRILGVSLAAEYDLLVVLCSRGWYEIPYCSQAYADTG